MSEIIEQNKIPRRALYDGTTVPAVGMGTFGSDKYGPEQIAEAVYGGIRAGYRLIDCASVYMNEDKIGESLSRVLKEGVVKREELFITSKVWNDMHAEGKVLESCEKSLKDLQLSYIDLYFVHWPFPNYHAPGCDGDSRNPDSRPFSVEEFMVTWRQCERLVEEGPYQCIISDAAPMTTGNRTVDTSRSEYLAEQVVLLAQEQLAPHGNLVIKIFQGGGQEAVLKTMRGMFRKAKAFKPKACRDDSFEIYLIGLDRV